MDAAHLEGRTADLLAYRGRAPFAAEDQSSDEYPLPLFVGRGVAGEAPGAERLRRSASYGVLSVDAQALSGGEAAVRAA